MMNDGETRLNLGWWGRACGSLPPLQFIDTMLVLGCLGEGEDGLLEYLPDRCADDVDVSEVMVRPVRRPKDSPGLSMKRRATARHRTSCAGRQRQS